MFDIEMITKYKSQILTESPLTVECVCEYKRWYDRFTENKELNQHIRSFIKTIEDNLGERFTRKDVISFHKRDDINDITKFLSVMMWGYASDVNSRPDNRGPSRVQKMLTSGHIYVSNLLVKTKELVKADRLIEAYNEFEKKNESGKKKVPMCGPNFFSKYFYFVGKSLDLKKYPLIFDDRVAVGLVKICTSCKSLLNLVSITTIRHAKIYKEYVDFIHDCAEKLQCEADQIEFFLFQYDSKQVG
jgi:hypothetical protein